jgi:hypothetical protein
MIRGCIASTLLVTVVFVLSPGTGNTMPLRLDLIGLGGFTVGSGPQEVRLSNSDIRSFQGQDVLGIECRASALWWSSFLGVSYKAGGFCDIGIPEDFESELTLHSHFIQIVAGRNLRLGAATLGLGLGYSYVIDRFSIKAEGGALKEREEKDSGCVLGARVSAPLSRTVAILWDYELLLRPSLRGSGSLLPAGTYTLRQGSVHHFVLGGLSIRIM